MISPVDDPLLLHVRTLPEAKKRGRGEVAAGSSMSGLTTINTRGAVSSLSRTALLADGLQGTLGVGKSILAADVGMLMVALRCLDLNIALRRMRIRKGMKYVVLEVVRLSTLLSPGIQRTGIAMILSRQTEC